MTKDKETFAAFISTPFGTKACLPQPIVFRKYKVEPGSFGVKKGGYITFPNGSRINWKLEPGQIVVDVAKLAENPDFATLSPGKLFLEKWAKMNACFSRQISFDYQEALLNDLRRSLRMKENDMASKASMQLSSVESQVLSFNHSALPHYNAGIILITEQCGYKKGKEFKATNGIIIKQKLKAGWDAATDSFYLRGSNDLHSANPVLVSPISKYHNVVMALKDYIRVHEYVSLDLMIKCHRETWLAVAKGVHKEVAAEAIAKQYGILVPRAYCFLCEYAANQANSENFCKCCPALNKWGFGLQSFGLTKPIERCVHSSSYYTMWDLEQDLALKSALARRIAYIMDDTINEYERDLIDAGERIKGVKALRERTGLGLREAKDLVDRYIEDSIN